MAPLRTIAEHEIHLWTLPLGETIIDSAAPLLLSTDEKERAARFVFDRDRYRFISGRSQLRKLLAQYTGMTPADIRFLYNNYGKPSIEGNLQFNVSHSENLMVVVCTLNGNIGVDIEKQKMLDDQEGLARTVFTPEEFAIFTLQKDEEKGAFFYKLWVRKEALLKAAGVGIGEDLKKINVGETKELSLSAKTVVFQSTAWRITDIKMENPTYSGAVCYPNNENTIVNIKYLPSLE